MGLFLRRKYSMPPVASEAQMRKAFDGSIDFIDRSLDFVESHAGRHTSGGKLDFGLAAYRWQSGNFNIELWFKEDGCSEIDRSQIDVPRKTEAD